MGDNLRLGWRFLESRDECLSPTHRKYRMNGVSDARLLHAVDQRRESLDAHFEPVSRLDWPNSAGCAGENHVARQQCHIGGNKTHQPIATEYELAGIGTLAQLPVLKELNR